MMDIEAIVKKHLDDNWYGEDSTGYDDVADAMRAALNELAAEYEQQITELQAMAINNGQQAVLLGERVKQLEADKAEYDRRIVAVGGVAINSVSREYHEAEVARLNALYESAVKGRQDFREAYRSQLEAERVPDGWKLVPTEATTDMVKAGMMVGDVGLYAIYGVMIDAAPAKEGE